MRNRLVLAAAVALTSACLLSVASGSGSIAGNTAQSLQDRSAVGPNIVLAQATTDPKNQPKKPPPQPPVRAVTPPARVIAPTVAPKVVAPVVAPKVVAPVATPKFVAPTGPKVVSPTTNNPVFVPRSSGQRAVGPGGAGPGGNAARALAIRGANNTAIAGRNFSVRRGSYRAYRGGYWRTFVGVGTLGAILYGGYRYYPYAYIDAPPDLCEGETEDGCQLQWQEVQTLEGPPDFQCVAYCPWQ
jgi:hypothetical protein